MHVDKLKAMLKSRVSTPVSLASTSVIAYLIAFVLLFFVYGHHMPMAAVIPVIMAAWLYGWAAGMFAALLSFPVNILLCKLVGIAWFEIMILGGTGIAGTAALALIGTVVGRMHDLSISLKRELRERQRAEAALQGTRDFLNNVIESSSDCIIVTDSAGCISRVNEYFRKLLAFRDEEVLGRHINEFSLFTPGTYETVTGDFVEIGREFRDRILELMFGFSESGRILNLETYLVRSDNRLVPIEANVVALYNEQRDMIGAVSIARDISERKRSERQIREAKDSFENVFENSMDAIITSNSNGTIINCNTAMERISGYRKEELIGQHIAFLVVDDEAERRNMMRNSIEMFEKGFSSYRFMLRAKQGTAIKLECNSSLIKNEQGVYIAGVNILRDISERERLEEQLRQSQKMQAIGTLAGGIAHDFNNILTAIIGYSELSLYDIENARQVRQHIEKILTSAYRARELVKQILTFSRHSDQQRRHLQPMHIIKEAQTLLRATLPTTIDIRYHIESESHILGDPTQIHQVIMNLCTNAADAMQAKGGILEISLADVAIHADETGQLHDLKPGPYVQLSVRDSGTGIAPEIMERIFDPFFTTKEPGKGTGMGLAVVHGIVQNHSGAIRFESSAGHGVVFHVLLPVVSEKISQAELPVPSVPTGTEHILLIDDDGDVLNAECHILESLGYRVTASQSSLEALDIFRAGPEQFDLVITDQTMPHITGYDLARRLIQIRPSILVILCTGYSETVSPEKALASAIKAFVMKPFNRQEIAETIRRIIDQKDSYIASTS